MSLVLKFKTWVLMLGSSLCNSLLNYRLDRIYTEDETKSQDWEDGVSATSRQYLWVMYEKHFVLVACLMESSCTLTLSYCTSRVREAVSLTVGWKPVTSSILKTSRYSYFILKENISSHSPMRPDISFLTFSKLLI